MDLTTFILPKFKIIVNSNQLVFIISFEHNLPLSQIYDDQQPTAVPELGDCVYVTFRCSLFISDSRFGNCNVYFPNDLNCLQTCNCNISCSKQKQHNVRKRGSTLKKSNHQIIVHVSLPLMSWWMNNVSASYIP